VAQFKAYLCKLIMHPSHLPSNTLVITLSPPGKMFYLPSHLTSRVHSPDPSTGYASDPESEVRKVKQSGKPSPDTAGELADQRNIIVSLSRRRHRARAADTSNLSVDVLKTAGWQDLFKYAFGSRRGIHIYMLSRLVTLQACILDNQGSLTDIVRGIDKILDNDVTSALVSWHICFHSISCHPPSFFLLLCLSIRSQT
jgi:hypothetical protein